MAEQEYGKGYVYILTNPSMPGLVKIGKTTRNSQTRAREISSGTGVPTPYKVAHERWVVDCHAAEREIHAELTRQRRNKNREFFKLKLDEAIEIVDEICDNYSVNTVVSSSAIPTKMGEPLSKKKSYTTQQILIMVFSGIVVITMCINLIITELSSLMENSVPIRPAAPTTVSTEITK